MRCSSLGKSCVELMCGALNSGCASDDGSERRCVTGRSTCSKPSSVRELGRYPSFESLHNIHFPYNKPTSIRHTINQHPFSHTSSQHPFFHKSNQDTQQTKHPLLTARGAGHSTWDRTQHAAGHHEGSFTEQWSDHTIIYPAPHGRETGVLAVYRPVHEHHHVTRLQVDTKREHPLLKAVGARLSPDSATKPPETRHTPHATSHTQ
jgi:hypothetical protein